MKRTLLVAPIVVLASACSAEAPPPPIADGSQAISGGQFDDEHTFVVGMYTQQGYSGGMCTGTLIAPNLVLTARHCVAPSLGSSEYVVCGQSGFGTPYKGTNVHVTADIQLSQKSNWLQGSEVRVPSEGNDTCGFDVALIILAQNSDITPAVPRIDREVEVGETYSAVGYGSTGYSYGGSRMIRTGLTVQCTPGNCSGYSGVQSTEWGGETGICQGDSGGPALDTDKKVIGVVSRGIAGCDQPTYGGVSAWRDFIIQGALDAAKAGGYEPPFWAVTGKSDPEPVEPPPANPGPETPSAQGTSCAGGQGCPGGYACYSPGSVDDAFCAATCGGGAACGAGLTCDATLGVCLPDGPNNDAEGASAGCAVAFDEDRGPVRPVPWVIGLVGLALLVARRRRCAR